MTPPMTPREKVVFKQPCEHCQRMTTVDLTALASGSGDHAELEVVAWGFWTYYRGPKFQVGVDQELVEFDYRHLGPCMDKPKGVQPLVTAASAQTILAENAALRGERDEWRSTVKFNERCWSEERGVMIDRATEAERKLAEAVSVLGEIAKGEAPPEQHGHYLAHRQAVDAARTFLSEAHQAREQGRGIWQ